jgi:hypothetical protein
MTAVRGPALLLRYLPSERMFFQCTAPMMRRVCSSCPARADRSSIRRSLLGSLVRRPKRPNQRLAWPPARYRPLRCHWLPCSVLRQFRACRGCCSTLQLGVFCLGGGAGTAGDSQNASLNTRVRWDCELPYDGGKLGRVGGGSIHAGQSVLHGHASTHVCVINRNAWEPEKRRSEQAEVLGQGGGSRRLSGLCTSRRWRAPRRTTPRRW